MRLPRGLTRFVGTLPYSLAVGAVGFAYLSPSATAGRLTPVPTAPRRLESGAKGRPPARACR